MTFTIERLGYLGDAITSEGLKARRMLPGEEITGAVVDQWIANPKIVRPSNARIKPACTHYNTCGGCDLLHAKDDFVRNWRLALVGSALRAQGIDAAVQFGHASPPHARRRAKLTGQRTKSGAIVGFHARAGSKVTSIPNCQVLTSGILALLPWFEALAREFASRKSAVEFQVTECANGFDVDVTANKTPDPKNLIALGAQMRAQAVQRLTWNGEVLVQEAPPEVLFADLVVQPPVGAFLQATQPAQEAMITRVLDDLRGAKRVIDLFAGCGTFALPLSQHSEVLAVESEASALDALHAAWRRVGGLHKMATLTRDLFRSPLSGQDFDDFDAVVIDPPRAGAEAQFRALAASTVAKICSVSCNPVTFARDARIAISGGYELRDVSVIDQFRGSAHVEIQALFEK